MPHALLYILIGTAGFAALGHWIEANRPRADVRAQLLAGFLALAAAGLGLATLLTLAPDSLQRLLLGGGLVMAAGILVWSLLPWVLHAFTRSGHPLPLTLLSTGWALLFLANLLVRPGLIYNGWQAPAAAWLPTMSPWWWLLQVLMILTLGYSALLLARRYREEPAAALVLMPVPGLLAFGFGWDLMVAGHAIAGPYLMVYLLLICAPYLSLQMRGAGVAESSGDNGAMTLARQPPQSEPADPRQGDLRNYTLFYARPVAQNGGIASSPYRVESRDANFILHPVQVSADHPEAFVFHPSVAGPPQVPTGQEPSPDTARDTGIGDVRQELTDISVYTGMLLHQLGQEQQDTRAMMVLCGRLRERVRDALHRAGQPGE